MKRQTITIKMQTLAKPRKRLVQRLISNSKGYTYDNARREWGIIDVVRREDDAFVHHCELCGARNYEQNLLIRNENNNKELKIGIDCASRFVVLNGCATIEDSALLVKQRVEESTQEFNMSTLYKVIRKAPKPSNRDINVLRDMLIHRLTLTGRVRKHYTIEDLEDILETVLDVKCYDSYDVKLLVSILVTKEKFDPNKSYGILLSNM